MKYALLFLLLNYSVAFCQVDKTSSKNTKAVSTTEKHIAESDGYSVLIPSWFEHRQNENPRLYGGMLPKVDGIANAIMITSFDKSDFKSFADFQRIYITGNKFGQKTLFSDKHIWYGRNEKDFKKIKNGVSSRVFTLFEDKIYHNQFVLLETSKSFLFINFVATPETYVFNLPKFDEFLKGLQLL